MFINETNSLGAFPAFPSYSGIDIDFKKAVRLNRYYQKKLGWKNDYQRILNLLGYTTTRPPNEESFAQAVALWQRNQGFIGKNIDGVIGPDTWKNMQAKMGLTQPTSSPPQTTASSSQTFLARVRDLISRGFFGLSLINDFTTGKIWNEDHLALEVLFNRQPKLRPANLDTLSDPKRLSALYKLSVKHRRALAPIREQIIRPIFGNPANFPIGSTQECQILDLRSVVDKLQPIKGGNRKGGGVWYKKDAQRSPRKESKVDSIVLHHMAFNRGNDVYRYTKVGAQYIVMADGKIAQLYDDLDYLNSSNTFNPRCVSIEFAGNFPDLSYHWWKSSELTIPGRCFLTPAQIHAGRCLLTSIKKRHPGIKYLYAHRQSSKTRSNDPGPDVWFNIAEWAIRNLNLTDLLPSKSVGTGKPIPANWRTARPKTF